MKRFLVFSGDIREKFKFGWDTFVDDFDNEDEAKRFAYNKIFPDGNEVPVTDEELIANGLEKGIPTWSQVVDSEIYEVIEEYV